MSDSSTEFEKTGVFQSEEALFEEGHLKMSLFQSPEGSKLESQKSKNKKCRATQREGHSGRKSHSCGSRNGFCGKKEPPNNGKQFCKLCAVCSLETKSSFSCS